MFDPGQTSLFGITGGGVLGGVLLGILLFVGFEAAASIGEESEDPHRSIPRALHRHGRRRGGVLRLHGVRVLDRLRQEGRVSEGAWAFSPAPVSEMATEYVGSWFATLLELVVILDAMALALAICVMIGRGFFALGRDGLLPKAFAKTSRHDTPWVGNLMVAVGGVGLILLVLAHRLRDAVRVRRTRRASSCRSSRTTSSRRSSSRPRSARSRSSSSTSSSLSRRSGSCVERQQVVAVPDRRASRSRRRSSASTAPSIPSPTTARTTTGSPPYWTIGLIVVALDLVRDRRPACAETTSTTLRRTRPSTTASLRSTRRSGSSQPRPRR